MTLHTIKALGTPVLGDERSSRNGNISQSDNVNMTTSYSCVFHVHSSAF